MLCIAFGFFKMITKFDKNSSEIQWIVFFSSEILADVDVRDVDLPYVMHTISEDIDGLPPGGGLSSK